MVVSKSLYAAPEGITPSDPLDEETIEVDIGEEGEYDEYGEDAEQTDIDEDFNENLAESMDDSELGALATDLLEEYEGDRESRSEWIKTYTDGLDLLGIGSGNESDVTPPFEGACEVHHPLLAETLVKFQSETMMETFPAQGPVKTKILGEETPEKNDAAERVREDMNYQLTERMCEYRPEHERMLWGLGLSGNAFKKIYYDPTLERQTSVYVSAEDLVVPYGAGSLETSERVTHVMRKTSNEVRKLQEAGFYLSVDLGDPVKKEDEVEQTIAEKQGLSNSNDNRHRLLEMHVDIVLEEYLKNDIQDAEFEEVEEEETDEVGLNSRALERVDELPPIAKPYVITIDEGTSKVLAIRRNWKPDDPKARKRNHFVHYSYVPGFGFYAFGLIHLIGAFAKSGTSLIRQLVDAGTLANLPAGFKTKGLRVIGDDSPIGPGEWKDVDIASGTLRDNLMPLPYKEPSPTLFQLLQTIVDEGRRFASAGDLKVSDMSSQAPVGTTLAILERTLKVMSAVQARIHYAMKQEFKLLKEIIRDYTDDEYGYDPARGERKVKQADYDLVEVIPVSDPNAATTAQKIVQYQAVIQLAAQAPQLYDMPYLHRQMLEVLGIKNVDKLIPIQDEGDYKPRDPVSENMDIINNKPVKAFITQDHQAHIAVHMAAMQDPKIQQLMGQNPKAPLMMEAMNAHIAEHLAFEYRRQVEEQAGVPLPPPDAPMDAETEVHISRLTAAAAGQLLRKNQAEAAQQAAQEAAEDPILQLQKEEIAIKRMDSESKSKKTLADIAAEADRLAIERERIASNERIAGVKLGVDIAKTKAATASREQTEGLRIGIDAARSAVQEARNEDERHKSRAERKELAEAKSKQTKPTKEK